MMEVRGPAHIAMLFVERGAQRRGVARALIAAAFPAGRPGVPITVNATPGSVAAYARLGFHATGPVRTTDGLRVVPMEHAPGGGAPPGGEPTPRGRAVVSSRTTR
jgi:GNAT superfamily N-acetyltransferase